MGDRVMRCPKCKSQDVIEAEHIIEITRMRCRACGEEELCDPYQCGEWWAAEDEPI